MTTPPQLSHPSTGPRFHKGKSRSPSYTPLHSWRCTGLPQRTPHPTNLLMVPLLSWHLPPVVPYLDLIFSFLKLLDLYNNSVLGSTRFRSLGETWPNTTLLSQDIAATFGIFNSMAAWWTPSGRTQGGTWLAVLTLFWTSKSQLRQES